MLLGSSRSTTDQARRNSEEIKSVYSQTKHEHGPLLNSESHTETLTSVGPYLYLHYHYWLIKQLAKRSPKITWLKWVLASILSSCWLLPGCLNLWLAVNIIQSLNTSPSHWKGSPSWSPLYFHKLQKRTNPSFS